MTQPPTFTNISSCSSDKFKSFSFDRMPYIPMLPSELGFNLKPDQNEKNISSTKKIEQAGKKKMDLTIGTELLTVANKDVVNYPCPVCP